MENKLISMSEIPTYHNTSICSCKNAEIGSYDNQIELLRPTHMIGRNEGSSSDIICVDKCLKDEILLLWNKGIRTTGCCCGHNKLPAYIGVIDDDIEKMKQLGYEVILNNLYPDREDSFKPKSNPLT